MTWYIPADPEISPANDTGALAPPMVTVTALTVAAFSGDAKPAATGSETCPYRRRK